MTNSRIIFILIKLVDLHACFCSLEKEFKVQTCVIPIDFGSQDVYPKIFSAIEGLEIGILGKFKSVVMYMYRT